MVASPPQQPAAYYDYSEGSEQIARKPVNMAMHVPGQPPQPPHQHRLADPSSSSSSSPSRQRPTSGSASVNSPTQPPAGQFHHLQHSHNPNRGPPHPNFNNPNPNNNNNNHLPSDQKRPVGARDLLPSYNHSTGPHPNTYSNHTMDVKAASRAPGDDLFPPNKVDIDAARYREAQQQAQAQARRSERSGSTRDRPTQTNTAKDSRDRRATGIPQINGRTSAGAASPGGFHGQQRPISPESLSSPNGLGPGTSIQRLPTPSVANSVLQPLDAKVAEYGTLMGEAQDEMARLDEEMRGLQERQRLAEQRFLEAKAKHDDYRRQYNDVEKALRGEYPAAAARKDRERGGEYTHNNHNGANTVVDDDQQRVPPTPSMPDLQHYGQAGASASGNLLNGNGGHPGMRSQRTVSIQSEYMDGDARPGSKRGRWSKLFGV